MKIVPEDHQEDEGRDTEDQSGDGEGEGEEDIFHPWRREGSYLSYVTAEESIDHGDIGMSEEMVDGDTGRKRSMVGGPRTEEGGGGGHGG